MLALLLAAPTLAATLTVGPTGGYATLSEAVAAAASGDDLVIEAGTYAGCVDLGGRTLVIAGAGSTATTLDGAGCAAVFTANAAETATISGLSITNVGGRAVAAANGAAIILNDVAISSVGEASLYGGAISLDNASATISNSALSAGTAERGGLVWVSGGGVLSLVDTTLSAGLATDGGAVYVGAGSALNLEGATLSANTASEGGGAIYLGEDATLDDAGSAWTANTAYRGGAIYAPEGASVTLTDATLSGNLAEEHGGAIYGELGLEVVATGGSFTGNQALYGSGGAFFLYGTGAVILSETSITQGFAWSDGGALYLDYNIDFSMEGGSLRENTALTGAGGALYQTFYGEVEIEGAQLSDNQSQGSGGALYLDFLVGQARIEDCVFSGNRSEAGDGGALTTNNSMDLRLSDSTFASNAAGYEGGALSLDPAGLLEIADTTFTDNVATAGGGGAIRLDAWTEDAYYASLDRLTLSGNMAALDGGAISAVGLAGLALGSATLVGNRADTDGLGRGGGALYVEAVSSLTLTHSCLCANEAQDGGALYLREVGAADGRNNALLENRAGGSGAAIFAADTSLALVNNDLLSNEAGAGAVHVEGGQLTLVNNLLAWSVGGAISADAAGAAAATLTYDAWFENDLDAVGAITLDTSADGNLVAAPQIVDYRADGACGDDLSLLAGSPLIDAGDPTIYDGNETRSDIGATGGPLEDGLARTEDTSEPADDSGEDDTGGVGGDDKETGCGCAAGGAAYDMVNGLVLLLALGRRRRRAD